MPNNKAEKDSNALPVSITDLRDLNYHNWTELMDVEQPQSSAALPSIEPVETDGEDEMRTWQPRLEHKIGTLTATLLNLVSWAILAIIVNEVPGSLAASRAFFIGFAFFLFVDMIVYAFLAGFYYPSKCENFLINIILHHSITAILVSLVIYDTNQMRQIFGHIFFLTEVATIFLHARRLAKEGSRMHTLLQNIFVFTWGVKLVVPIAAMIIYPLFSRPSNFPWIISRTFEIAMLEIAGALMELLYAYWTYKLFFRKQRSLR